VAPPIHHNALSFQVPYHLWNSRAAPHDVFVAIITEVKGARQDVLHRVDEEALLALYSYH
jgi:hypothetical protein